MRHSLLALAVFAAMACLLAWIGDGVPARERSRPDAPALLPAAMRPPQETSAPTPALRATDDAPPSPGATDQVLACLESGAYTHRADLNADGLINAIDLRLARGLAEASGPSPEVTHLSPSLLFDPLTGWRL